MLLTPLGRSVISILQIKKKFLWNALLGVFHCVKYRVKKILLVAEFGIEIIL